MQELSSQSGNLLSVEGDRVPKFLSNLEDEINNPLPAISATVELLLQSTAGIDVETMSRLQLIETSAARIQKAVSSLSQAVREQ